MEKEIDLFLKGDLTFNETFFKYMDILITNNS